MGKHKGKKPFARLRCRWRVNIGMDLPNKDRNFVVTVSRPALGPIQPQSHWVPEILSPGVKRLGREADHSPSSSAEVKNGVELYLHSLNMSLRVNLLSCGYTFMELYFVKHKDNIPFTLTGYALMAWYLVKHGGNSPFALL
jgi:hypothetical protein